MTEGPLQPDPEDAFDGETYEAGRDYPRLNKQQKRVWDAMIDGRWHTPEALEQATGDRWSSISARLRDFRKDKYGNHDVLREYWGNGQYAYKLSRDG